MPVPMGSEPGFTRPVVIIQADLLNSSDIATVVVATFTSNLSLGDMPGNVLVERIHSGLPKDSVVNVSQVATLDKYVLTQYVGILPENLMASVNSGLRRVLGL